MPVINQESGTTIDEIVDGIHRISTPVPPSEDLPPGFTFNQYLRFGPMADIRAEIAACLHLAQIGDIVISI